MAHGYAMLHSNKLLSDAKFGVFLDHRLFGGRVPVVALLLWIWYPAMTTDYTVGVMIFEVKNGLF